jgi:hypothetical protein
MVAQGRDNSRHLQSEERSANDALCRAVPVAVLDSCFLAAYVNSCSHVKCSQFVIACSATYIDACSRCGAVEQLKDAPCTLVGIHSVPRKLFVG